MLNSYSFKGGDTSQSVHINAVTGAILKNHPKSWFERFNLNSKRAEALLVAGGHVGGSKREQYGTDRMGYPRYETKPVHDPEKDIVVLQMVICGDMEVMAECVYRRDYEATEGGPEA